MATKLTKDEALVLRIVEAATTIQKATGKIDARTGKPYTSVFMHRGQGGQPSVAALLEAIMPGITKRPTVADGTYAPNRAETALDGLKAKLLVYTFRVQGKGGGKGTTGIGMKADERARTPQNGSPTVTRKAHVQSELEKLLGITLG